MGGVLWAPKKEKAGVSAGQGMLSRRRGLYAVGACVSIHIRAPNSKKAQRMSRPAVKGNVSCAGEGAIIARPLIVALLHCADSCRPDSFADLGLLDVNEVAARPRR
jgi:hypothetical protein